MTDPDKALASLMEYYRELEMVTAILAAKFGERGEAGFRLTLTGEEAMDVRQLLGTGQPVVICTFDTERLQYVIDVL